LSPCNTSFVTQSDLLIFTIFLQHHNSKLRTYLLFIFRSDQVSAPYKATLQIYHSNSFVSS